MVRRLENQAGETPGLRGQPSGASERLSPGDLGDLLKTFNEVTTRLHDAHETLTDEVARLKAELLGANRQLRRARQLAALGEMAAGIAHEVRNPLGSIKLYARVLVEDLAHLPEQATVAQKIVGAVDRLNAVVGDVLAFSREITPRAIEATAWHVVEPAVEAAREPASRFGVTVECDESALRRVQIRGDLALLAQAMANVVRNGCEAFESVPTGRGAGGERRVSIAAERRRVAVPGGNGRRADAAVIVVSDNGPGVPEEALARVFNPFFTTRHTGTGLGLAIVHRIVDAHGGSVSIRNNSDGPSGGSSRTGATVEIMIPDAADDEITDGEKPGGVTAQPCHARATESPRRDTQEKPNAWPAPRKPE